MKKEIKEEVKVEVIKVANPDIPVKPKVGKLDLSFPNEDLNKLVSKVNEIIDSL